MRLLYTAFLVSAVAVAINHIGSARADVSSLTSERKINLEDIERDTLINEIRSKSQETLQAEPTEHIPPTAAGPGPVHQQVQHVQHTGPTAATPTGSGGAVSHQTIVYHHQNGGHHQQSFTSDDQQQPTAPAPTAQYPSGITYAQPNPQYNPSTAPEYHYSLSAPAGHYPQQAVQYIQQPIQQGHPQVLTHQPVVYYSHHAHYPQEPVQYVTFQPQHQQPYHHHHIASNLVAPQVHEEGRTYSAPSRHTLETNTQQQKFFKSQPQIPVGFRPKPALINPQPQYVYVQAGNVASANQQRQYQQKYQQQQQQQQQVPTPAPHKVQNVEIVASQGHQIAPVEYVPQQSTVQSTPYYQYSGSFGHPQAQSVPANNYVVVPYATNPGVYHHHRQQQQQIAPSTAPSSSLNTQPIVPEVPHYVHPTKTVIPSGPPQVYIQPPHHHTHSYVTPSHPPPYPTVAYAPNAYSGNGLSFGHGHNYNYYTPSLDLFGQYSRHTSLLDSYVPSNLVYSKARQVFNPYYSQSQAPVPSSIIPQAHIESEHSPVYNTIAYSTEQKPVVVPPPQPSKRESTVLRATTGPIKPTSLTKMENLKKI